ncbi:MAG: hypothetical protein U0Q03_13225 [Acidimicrobiales bacterium]
MGLRSTSPSSRPLAPLTPLASPPLPRRARRRSGAAVAAVAAVGALVLGACGGGTTSSAAEVASIGTDAVDVDAASDTTAPVDTQQAWLDFAQCMRDNGVDMQDPTFDADGNVQGGFGPDSGIDPRDADTQAAMDACSDLIEGLDLGGPGGRGGFDPDQMQIALADYTACLRDQGLDVDDITFGPQGGQGAQGAPDGQATDGSVPAGGFGAPPDGSAPDGATGTPPDGATSGQGGQGGQGGPPQGGEGFDPTDRIIEQLGLDADDPTVSAALDACQSLLDEAFQPTDGSGDTTGTTDTSDTADASASGADA